MTGDRVVRLPRPAIYDLPRTMRQVQYGPLDPSARIEGEVAWRATRTPNGPASFRVALEGEALRVDAWGAGSEWVIERADRLTGISDDPSAFQPANPILAPLARKFRGIHLACSLRIMEQIVPTILQQLVTWREAMRAMRKLIAQHGEAAPGPADLMLLPPVSVLERLPEYSYAPMGALAKHARAVREAARHAEKLERAATLPYDEGFALLTKVRGIGPWTAALTLATATGHPDAVPTGDLHLPSEVSWALARERDGTDARMLELLEPFRPHRWRAILLIRAGHLGPPRRAPRRGMRPLP